MLLQLLWSVIVLVLLPLWASFAVAGRRGGARTGSSFQIGRGGGGNRAGNDEVYLGEVGTTATSGSSISKGNTWHWIQRKGQHGCASFCSDRSGCCTLATHTLDSSSKGTTEPGKARVLGEGSRTSLVEVNLLDF